MHFFTLPNAYDNRAIFFQTSVFNNGSRFFVNEEINCLQYFINVGFRFINATNVLTIINSPVLWNINVYF